MAKLYPLKLYLKQTPNMVLLGLSLVLNLAIWGWLLYNIRFQEDAVFLHYTILFGVDLTGSWYKVYSMPFLGLCLLFLNALMGWVVYDKDELVAFIMNGVTAIVHVFLLIAASILVFLNV